MKIELPEFCLVLLVGPSASGKSTFGREHFLPTEVVSSDRCRALVSDSEVNQDATGDAFDVLHYLVRKRLKRRRLTVVDATNVQAQSRQSLLKLAKEYHCLTVAIVFDLDKKVCVEYNETREDRKIPNGVVRRHIQELRRSYKSLKKREGYLRVFQLKTPEEVEAVEIIRRPLWNDKRDEHGPFDIIGDIHGCFDELVELLERLGYEISENGGRYDVTPPEGRKVIFLGDLVDRGPKIPQVLRLAMDMVSGGTALCVPGNHDFKLLKKLDGKKVKLQYGLQDSVEQLEEKSDEFIDEVRAFLRSLISHYVLDDEKLVVSHAGLKEDMQGRASGKVRTFCLFGDSTGKKDADGVVIRGDWARDYRGKALVVYGHTAISDPQWINRTINIDTGCVFGGRLTALQYPEKELVSVEAREKYAEPLRPLAPMGREKREYDDLLDIDDVLDRPSISTRYSANIRLFKENARAALEVMSRYAVNPKWLIYLPPTMSPPKASQLDDFLEHPAEVFHYYGKRGVEKVICEEKHMGSRVVVVLCRDIKTARERFGVADGSRGICYTRTGRRFFNDDKLEGQVLDRLARAVEKAGWWDELETDWVCLDGELMPWSQKAQDLLQYQYAAVGAASQGALGQVVKWLEVAKDDGRDVDDLLSSYRHRKELVGRYADAYRGYCWPVQSVDDLQLAPFHLLATEGKVHTNRDHRWHMEQIDRLHQGSEQDGDESPSLLYPTEYRIVDLSDEAEVNKGTEWWLELTEKGGEGMVVKPIDFIHRNRGKVIQPAVKCRGREYLRIIYGPEYTLEDNLNRLKKRGLSTKRKMAFREFALGLEALDRFVAKEPLYRIHECVFAVLAMESEPVDPRL